MSEKRWIPPVELEPETGPPKAEAPPGPSPTVLAEEGEARFADYLREGRHLEEDDAAATVEAQAEALKRRTTRRRRRALRWFLGAGGLLLAGVLVLDTYTFLDDLFGRSAGLGLLFTTLIGVAVAALLAIVYEELRDIRRLRAISHLQAQAERLRQGGGHGGAAPLVTQIAELYQDRPDVEPGLERFRTTVAEAHSDAETLTLFSKQVLRPLDERAYRIVAKYASQTALITAVSPLALLDAMLSLWRNVRMARDVAALYGGRPGSLGTVVLIRGVVTNLTAAGVSDVLADAGAEAFGSTVVARFSSKAGQGMVMGLLTLRVGLATMRFCRPIPFQEEERPRMTRVRDEILKTVYRSLTGRG